MAEQGIKYDTGKPKLAKMIAGFWEALVETSRIYNHGGNKYGWENWRLVEEERYKESSIRHLAEILQGNDFNTEVDNNGAESTYYHACQLAWNALALCWFAIQREKQKNKVREGVAQIESNK